MIQVGRFVKVRGVGASGISPAYVLERRRAQWPAGLTRYREEDWFYDQQSGLVLPAMRGGLGPYLSGAYAVNPIGVGYLNLSATQTTTALSNNYVYATSGNAIAQRIMPGISRTLNIFYFFIVSYTGNAALVTDLNFQVRNDGGGGVKPGSTLINSGSGNPSSATGWKAWTGLSIAMTPNTLTWLIIGDANGGATNFATLLRNIASSSGTEDPSRIAGFGTTDGFTTNAVGASGGAMVMVYSDGFTHGCPFTASVAPASSTNRRGFRVNAGFFGDIVIHAFRQNTSVAALSNASGAELWLDNSGPSGTAWAPTTNVLAYPAGGTAGYVFDKGQRIREGTPFRFVITFSGVSTSMSRLQIGTGSDSNLRNARFGNGNIYWGQANGTTNWANDDVDSYPPGQIMLEDVWDAYGNAGLGKSRFESGKQIPAGL